MGHERETATTQKKRPQHLPLLGWAKEDNGVRSTVQGVVRHGHGIILLALLPAHLWMVIKPKFVTYFVTASCS